MVTNGHKCLRALVLLLLLGTLGIDITTFVKNWIYLDIRYDTSPHWQYWASMFLEAILALIYPLIRAMFMRHLRPLNKWLRCHNHHPPHLRPRPGYQGPSKPRSVWRFQVLRLLQPCYIARRSISRVVQARDRCHGRHLTEVMYTLYRRYRDPPPMPSKLESIIVVSPEQCHYGIPPNMTIPYGAAQPQPYLLQQQPVYPQPVYPNYTQPYPPPIQPATILSPQQQAILQNQSSHKHEDSSQIIQLHQ
ncbi:hypothetical protein BKA57DRAFT_435115 [Linnemannia elongata]|nr:hypothetical protein BKA57DRAFT_435115 [Linnemannia elongata]